MSNIGVCAIHILVQVEGMGPPELVVTITEINAWVSGGIIDSEELLSTSPDDDAIVEFKSSR